MIAKTIKVFVKPGHMQAYLDAQRIWNEATKASPGYLGGFSGQADGEPDVVYLHLYWRSTADLKAFMASDHDRIASLALADRHYERIEVLVIESVPNDLPLPIGEIFEPTLPADRIQIFSEAYRWTAALRAGIRADLFDRLNDGSAAPAELAERCGGEALAWQHLLRALATMGLVAEGGGRWRNTPLADRYLVSTSPAYQGAMVRHNSQPEYIARVFAFAERLGLEGDLLPESERHELFIRAMAATAAAGQADALVRAVNLAGCDTLLDVGGATGMYACALCHVHPRLRAVVIDQEATLPLARAAIAEAGLGDRVRIAAHDYRAGPFPRGVDVILISNILRGETQPAIDSILQRAFDALPVGGRLIVTDLFPDTIRQTGDACRAALFGLHLPDGMNATVGEMEAAIRSVGFVDARCQRLEPCVVMNHVIEAHRPE